MKHLRVSLIVALAFAAGVFCARAPQVARAADAVVEATSIDLTTLDPATFPPPNPALPNMRTKALATVDQTVFALSVGTAPKHTHESTTEVQLVMDGTGTEWLGDKQIPLKPGTFIVVPPHTAHGGFTGGPFRLYTVKTPPQIATDYHIVP
jgi:mannose-6-phosphate isomerase-like protein (cupin superfamily)